MGSNPSGKSVVIPSFESLPVITLYTIAQSSALLAIGPTLSIDQLKLITPCLLTLPYVGRKPVIPFRLLGDVIEPSVSVPKAKGTNPAEVAEPDPAEDPVAPCSVSHGFLVFPSNHTSPRAKEPETSLATKTPPAACNFSTTVAVISIC